ncbi:MAG TPA: cupin-like domain-containing protein [Sphingomonas sp.]|nr:cupin-like domain-containing protein [Sphingomonas sp.]
MVETPREIEWSANAGYDDFRTEIAQSGVPAVLRGVCRDWPARLAAGEAAGALFGYLAQFDSGATGEAFIGAPDIGGRYHYGEGPGGFNFVRETMGLTALLARIEDRLDKPDAESIYLGSIPTDTLMPGFAAENRLDFLPSSVRPRIWIGTASQVACHYDTYDNVACAVVGRRRFTLYPPDAIGDLYVGPIDHTMAGQPVALAPDADASDLRFPRFDSVRARRITAELEPGDALYLPKLWWHQVEARDPVNVLVNYWWDAFASGPDAPATTMMLAMIAIAERPAAERAAWHAFFDHYVFRPHGHPLAHLPEEQHGILGPLAKGNYGRIRAFVMQMLRGG